YQPCPKNLVYTTILHGRVLAVSRLFYKYSADERFREPIPETKTLKPGCRTVNLNSPTHIPDPIRRRQTLHNASFNIDPELIFSLSQTSTVTISDEHSNVVCFLFIKILCHLLF